MDDVRPPTEQDFANFMVAYHDVIEKHTGRRPVITRGEKYVHHFRKATALCVELKMDPHAYVEALIAEYSAVNHRRVIPFPNQFHGGAAEQFALRAIARSRHDPVYAAEVRAINSVRIKLDDDEEYQNALQHMRQRKHTEADVAYVSERQRQVYGETKPWMQKIIAQLRERHEKAAKAERPDNA